MKHLDKVSVGVIVKKILFIEDELDQVMLITERLKSNGFEVVSAADGEKGLQKALEELPDLILLDIVMPLKNGLEVASELKNNSKTRGIPIIILTASDMSSLDERCRDCGADFVMRKPYNSNELINKINELLISQSPQA